MTFAARSIFGVAGQVLNSIFNDSKLLTNAGASQATASIRFNNVGTVTGNDDVQPNWFSPTTTGIGVGYWVLVNAPTVGSFTTGTTGSRVQISSEPLYSATTTGSATGRQAEAQATYEIWDAASGGNIAGSGSITLFAEVDNT